MAILYGANYVFPLQRSITPMVQRETRFRNEWLAGQKEGSGKGPQTARWLVRPGGFLVPGGAARFAVSRPDADVDERG